MHLKRQHYIIGFTLIFVLALLVGLKLNKKCDKSDYARCKLLFGDISLDVTIAYSKESQAKGLMGVKNLKDNEGMIFVYDEPSYLSFWMKNTLIPLSIAFVEADGRISQIQKEKSSGNQFYDIAAESAIRSCNPFNPPNGQYRGMRLKFVAKFVYPPN